MTVTLKNFQRQAGEGLERQRRAGVVRLVDDHHRTALGDDLGEGLRVVLRQRVAGGIDLPGLRIADAEMLDGRHQDDAGGVIGARRQTQRLLDIDHAHRAQPAETVDTAGECLSDRMRGIAQVRQRLRGDRR